MKTARLIGALVLCLSAVSFAQAQLLSNRIPADALIYIGWQGSANQGKGYAGSHLRQLLDSSNMRELFTELLPQVIAKATHSNHDAARIAGEVQGAVDLALKHATAVYVSPPTQGPPALVILTDAGPDAQALKSHYQSLITELRRSPTPIPLPMQVKVAGGRVYFVVGQPSDAEMIRLGMPVIRIHIVAPAPSLAGDQAFQSDMKQTLSHPALVVHVDTAKLFALAHMIPSQPHQPNAYAVIKALGLTGIQSVTIAGGFTGPDWSVAAFVKAPAPRSGILKALVAAPLDMNAFKHVPRTAMIAKSYRFSLSTFLNELDSALAQTAPPAHTRYR